MGDGTWYDWYGWLETRDMRGKDLPLKSHLKTKVVPVGVSTQTTSVTEARHQATIEELYAMSLFINHYIV